MEGHTRDEVAEYAKIYLNKDRKYKVTHKYQSACNGKELMIVEEV